MNFVNITASRQTRHQTHGVKTSGPDVRLKDQDQQKDGGIWMENSRCGFCVVSCMGQICTDGAALADLSPSERMNIMNWVLLLDLLYHCYLFVAVNKCD